MDVGKKFLDVRISINLSRLSRKKSIFKNSFRLIRNSTRTKFQKFHKIVRRLSTFEFDLRFDLQWIIYSEKNISVK